jgi:aminoglycoside phosphotransferase (APT) family kinase protein
MASTPFTLAALATLAIPGLVVQSAREHTFGDADELLAAVLVTDQGELIVRVPRDASSEQILGGELIGLAALTEGARSMLPFQVPVVLGQTKAGSTRAVVSTFLSGNKISSANIAPDALVLGSIAATLRAIHALPVSVAADAGLPVRSAVEARENAARLIRRAQETRLVPASVAARWELVLDDDRVWEFEPAVTHGNMQLDHLLVHNEHVTGVLGWSSLCVDDPAMDLAWLCAAGEATFDSALAHYKLEREVSNPEAFRARAFFNHELEVAKWLLHGVDSHDQTVIDDAVQMFDHLVDQLPSAPAAIPQHEAMSVTEVETLLTPQDEAHTEPIVLPPRDDSRP